MAIRRTKLEAEAYRRGKDAGKSQASWPDFDEKSAAIFIQGWMDGDPAIMDAYDVSPLSGEWAGESVNELLGDLFDESGDPDTSEYIMDEYAKGFEEMYWQELERRAMSYLDKPKRRRNKPGRTFAENPRKNVEQVMDAFAHHRKKGNRGDSISTDGESVFSYFTCLVTRVQRAGTVFLLNATRYSVTTTQQQGGIREILRDHGASVVEVEGLSRGADANDLLAQAGWSED
jgi:hypothetical protein